MEWVTYFWYNGYILVNIHLLFPWTVTVKFFSFLSQSNVVECVHIFVYDFFLTVGRPGILTNKAIS